MNRLLLLVAVAVVIVGGGALGTGAVDGVFSDADDVEIDDEAIVLEPADAPEGDVYASLEGDDGNEELIVDIDNLNQPATTRIDNVFTASYTGDQEGRIHFEDVGDDATIYDMETGEPVESEGDAVILRPGDDERSFGVDVTADEDADSVLLEDITVVARAVEPDFRVVDIERPPEQASVIAGERVTIEVTIENRGAAFPREITLNEASRGDPVDSTTISLDDGGSRTVAFEYRTRASDANGDELSFGVDAVDDAVAPGEDGAATLRVEEPDAEFDVGEFEVDADSVTAGSTVTTTAAVENVGGDAGSGEIDLLVDGDAVNTAEVTLAEGGETTVELDYVPVIGDADEIDLELRSTTDDTETETVKVEELVAFEIADIEDTTDDGTITLGDDGEAALEVEPTIQNDADERSGVARVWLEFDGSREDFATVAIEGGESESVELSATVDSRDVGERSVSVFTEDDDREETIEVREPAAFTPGIDEITPGTVSQGGSVEVDATVLNEGGVEATQDVELSVDGSVVDTESVSLEGGDDEELTLTADIGESVGPGPVEVTVESEDGSDSATATIRQPAAFDVEIADARNPVFTDETLSVDAAVTNVGDEPGETDVVLFAGGEELDAAEVRELAGGDTETVTLTSDISDVEVAPDAFDFVIETPEDSASATVEVREAPDDPFFRLEGATVDPEDVPRFDDQTITAEATATNTGEEVAEQTVAFLVDGEVLDDETLDLEGGESESVAFEVDATDLETGTRALAIETDDSDRETTITVREPHPAAFDADITDADPGDTIADETEVTVDVTNTGEEDGTADIELEYATDGGRTLSETVETETSVPAGETETETLTVDIGAVPRAGSFDGELTLTVDGGEDTATDDVPVVLEFGPIDEAIDAASADEAALIGASPPDPTETVTIDESGVAVVDVGGSTLEPGVDTVFEIRADEVTIEEFTLSAAAATDATAIDIADGVEDTELVGLAIGGSDWSTAVDDSGEGTEIRYADVRSVDRGVVGTGSDLVLRDSRIRNSGNATDLTGGASNATIRNTDLVANERALFSDAGSHTMTENNLERNDAAIETKGTEAEVFIDAPDNWWGRAAGPKVAENEGVSEAEADILSNVDFTAVSTPFEEADFAVEEFDERTIAEDETLELELTVGNDGGTSGATARQDIELLINGDAVDAETIQELDSDESTTVDLAYDPSEAGEFDAEIRSEDDSTEFDVTVLTAAEYAVGAIDTEGTVTAGETLSLTADIENLGEADGNKDVVLAADGEAVDRASAVGVGGGATGGVTLAYTPNDSEAGPVTLEVSVPDDDSVGTETITVEEPEPEPVPGGGGGGGDGAVPSVPDEGTPTPEPGTPESDTPESETPGPDTPEPETPAPDTPDPDDETPIDEPADLPGFGVGVALVALLAAALLARRR